MTSSSELRGKDLAYLANIFLHALATEVAGPSNQIKPLNSLVPLL